MRPRASALPVSLAGYATMVRATHLRGVPVRVTTVLCVITRTAIARWARETHDITAGAEHHDDHHDHHNGGHHDDHRYEGERTQLTAWAQHKGLKGLAAYREEMNQRGIDGRISR